MVNFIGFSQNKIHIVIRTTLGDIEVELYPDKAPKTVENFLKYVKNDLYNNASFFRVCTAENEADYHADQYSKAELDQGFR